METQIQTFTTKETATLIRRALKSAFPETKFSVRKDTGSACAWINVSWVDGPTDSEVEDIAHRYEGQRFDGMTDSSERVEPTLMSMNKGELPVEVQFLSDGVLCTRTLSVEANEYFKGLILEVLDGKEDTPENLNWITVAGVRIPDVNFIESAVRYLSYHLDLPISVSQ